MGEMVEFATQKVAKQSPADDTFWGRGSEKDREEGGGGVSTSRSPANHTNPSRLLETVTGEGREESLSLSLSGMA